MQKMAYLYGWQDRLTDLDETDDDTLAQLALFFGLMLGVGGASAGLSNFLASKAAPAMEKQIFKKALTKATWYPVVKKSLAKVGVDVTKGSVAKSASKAVPLVGGAVSGGMTYVSLRNQSERLHKHLRKIPPPGMDPAEHARLIAVVEDRGDAQGGAPAGKRRGMTAGRVGAGVRDLPKRLPGGSSGRGADETHGD